MWSVIGANGLEIRIPRLELDNKISARCKRVAAFGEEGDQALVAMLEMDPFDDG